MRPSAIGQQMTDTLRDRILHILIDNTPPEYLAMPGDLSDLATALIRELPELQRPVSMSDYATHLCQSGCDCSCCYGMDDCYHVTDPCNCGMAAKEHRL